jgi:hypothetical protein
MRSTKGQLSPELETLDQLLHGDISLGVIRKVFPDDGAFLRGVKSLLVAGDVSLWVEGEPVTQWQWRELFGDGAAIATLQIYSVRLTEQGARRIA